MGMPWYVVLHGHETKRVTKVQTGIIACVRLGLDGGRWAAPHPRPLKPFNEREAGRGTAVFAVLLNALPDIYMVLDLRLFSRPWHVMSACH